MPLSVVINTKNAAATLPRTLKSIHKIADEIIVVDMMSTDETLAIARQQGARTFSYQVDHGYADPARNFALEKAQHEWILVIDADEEVSPTLAKKVADIVSVPAGESDVKCFFIPRQNYIWEEWIEHTGWWPDYQARLFVKGAVSWEVGVHRPPDVKGLSEYLPPRPEFALIHQNYPTVASYVDRLNRYTQLAAHETLPRHLNGDDFPDAFWNEFLRRAFEFEGIKDGARGVSLSLLQASYELVFKLKQWENSHWPPLSLSENRTIKHLANWQHSLAYWVADWHVRHTSGLVQIWWRIRRRLQF